MDMLNVYSGMGGIMMPEKERANRLILEKSPYLLQHANNPVDWYPWGAEAFDRAKREDKPVFLSIGYSTCHWCHVMAHESFEDAEVAAALNRDFVCIKVDREERPDVDAVYMAVCQALTGAGGWPLTVLLTPEKKPFWAGTYLPKTARYGAMGLLELLDAVARQWAQNREKLFAAGEEITAYLRQPREHPSRSGAEPSKELLRRAADAFRQSYDARFGGFGAAPKFPAAHNLLFLLRYAALERDDSAQKMVEHTLAQMFRGGLFDHVGGGFSRYSTDERWLVPHFEKMLYDNALLAGAYLGAFARTHRPLYENVARRVLGYVLRELTDSSGAFFCGQDADSDGVEGKYYVFTPREVKAALGEADGEAFCRWFGITERGNFEGASIPNLLENPRYDEPEDGTDALCDKLYEYRLARTRLHKDDKVLTSWNALMIAALARAGLQLGEPRFLNAAKKARDFLAQNVTDARGRPLLRWRDGEAAHSGQLDDCAFLAFAALELYRAEPDVRYLADAVRLAEQMIEFFSDEADGGFFLYARDGEQLIARPKEVYDGAMPSGNSMAALVLARLARLTGETGWRERSDRQLRFVSGAAHEYPAGHSVSLLALAEALYPSQELVCALAGEEAPAELMELMRGRPGLIPLVKTRANARQLAQVAPFTESYPVPEHGAAYYLCQNGACRAPVSDIGELARLLD